MKACCPVEDQDVIDPLKNITPQLPPTFIAHGQNDTHLPIALGRTLFTSLEAHGVNCGMVEVPEEDHTFVAQMEVGFRTWNLQRKGLDFLPKVVGDG